MISRYITLGELMKNFHAPFFFRMSMVLGMFHVMKITNTSFESDVRDSLRLATIGLAEECGEIGLSMSAITLKRMVDLLDNPKWPFQTFLQQGEDLSQRLQDEMASLSFFAIEPTKQRFIVETELFGKDVAERFPSASTDIEEAGKCLAFERYTACVYHLMRVAEAALVVIGKRVGYESPKPGWGEALNFIDAGLEKARKKYEEASPLFKGDIEFLSGVSAQMHAVNQAWRQRVSHLERSYNEEEALRVWEATKGLMQHLATKMKEEPSV